MGPLPPSIAALFPREEGVADTIGCSQSRILLFPDRVLKIQPAGVIEENECAMLVWLKGRLPVPDILACERREDIIFLVISRLEGTMGFEGAWLSRPAALADALADALHAVWAVDTAGCPSCAGLDFKLAYLRDRVEQGLVDPADAEAATFGPGGFPSPEALLDWLERNRPEENKVFTHGDFTLPNIYLSSTGKAAYLDVGLAGVSDPWQDIALCWRSLGSNLRGKYGGPVYSGDPDVLFSALGIPRDADKLKYYLLLDELF